MLPSLAKLTISATDCDVGVPFEGERKNARSRDESNLDADSPPAKAPKDSDNRELVKVVDHLKLILTEYKGIVRAPSWTVTLPFVYMPENTVRADFHLSFKFVKHKKLQRILMLKGDEECMTIWVREDDETMNLSNLLYTPNPRGRELCEFKIQQSDDDDAKQEGVGAVLLGAAIEIAAGLGIKLIYLEDGAMFHSIHTAPFYGYVGITSYLRLKRGYGQYEARGFFEDSMSDVQDSLNRIHKRMTTPIETLLLTESDSNLIELLNHNDLNLYKKLSMRQILLDFDQVLKDYPRPTNVATIKDLPFKWAEEIHVDHAPLLNAAWTIVSAASFIVGPDPESDALWWKRLDLVSGNHQVVEMQADGTCVVKTIELPAKYRIRLGI